MGDRLNQLRISWYGSGSGSGSSSSSGEEKRISKYAGVVRTDRGRWAAQIWHNQRRTTLGAFRTEVEAAMAYDSAAMKLQLTREPARNLPASSLHRHLETLFQGRFSAAVLLGMITSGSYPNMFRDFCTSLRSRPNNIHLSGRRLFQIVCVHSFEKKLRYSNVKQVDRLIVPKKSAIRFYPEIDPEKPNGIDIGQTTLDFYDRAMRVWTFRYCFWKSRKTYALTRGWTDFVRAKGLNIGDVLVFRICETTPKLPLGHKGSTRFTVLDFRRCPVTHNAVHQGQDQQGRAKRVRLFGVDIVQE